MSRVVQKIPQLKDALLDLTTMRRWISALLVLCICWQSLSFAGLGVMVTDGKEMVHALLHFEGSSHHHDGHDDDVHQDESPASKQHAMSDACLFAPALLTEIVLPVLSIPVPPPSVAHANEPPPPFLRGPERPPQSRT
jgi:hypothetical protein